jgi:hypothetical protein
MTTSGVKPNSRTGKKDPHIKFFHSRSTESKPFAGLLFAGDWWRVKDLFLHTESVLKTFIANKTFFKDTLSKAEEIERLNHELSKARDSLNTTFEWYSNNQSNTREALWKAAKRKHDDLVVQLKKLL